MIKEITVYLGLILLFPVLLKGDVVSLENGDRLSGEVEGLSKGKLIFSTAYAGKVKIDWSRVTRLSTVGEYVVQFISGRSATGTIQSREVAVATIESAPPQVVPLTDIVTIRKSAALVEKAGLLDTWHGNADFGYSVRGGNSDVKNLTLNFEPERRTASNRTWIRLQSLYNVQNQVVSSGLYRGQVRYERYLDQHLFVFVVGLMEKDRRKSIDLRTSQGGGAGWRLMSGAGMALSLFGGATFLQERFTGSPRNFSGEALAGLEMQTKTFPPFVISTKSQILPMIGSSRYRLEWDGNIRVPVLAGFTLGVQLFDYFDSSPLPPQVKRNDFGVLSTLGFSF